MHALNVTRFRNHYLLGMISVGIIGSLVGGLTINLKYLIIAVTFVVGLVVLLLTVYRPTVGLVGQFVVVPLFTFAHNELLYHNVISPSTAILVDRIPLFIVAISALTQYKRNPVKVKYSVKGIALLYVFLILFYSGISMFYLPIKVALNGLWLDIAMILFFLLFQQGSSIHPKFVLKVIVTVSSTLGAIGAIQALFMGINGLKMLGLLIYSHPVPAGWPSIYAYSGALRFTSSGYLVRAVSLIGSPLSLAEILDIGVLGTICLWSLSKNKRNDLFYLFIVGAQIFELYLTYSRADWVSLIVGVLILIYSPAGRRVKRLYSLGVILITGFFIVILYIFLIKKDFGLVSYQNGSEAGHLLSYRNVFASILNNPLGTGVGSIGLAQVNQGFNTGLFAEGWYLQIFGEIGVLGLVIFAIFYFKLYKELSWQISLGVNQELELIVQTWVSIFFVMLLVGIQTPIWADMNITAIFWGGLGLLLSYLKNSLTNELTEVAAPLNQSYVYK